MEENVGGLDRNGRIVIGIVLGIAGLAALAGYWAGPILGGIAVIVAIVLLATSLTRKCIINDLVGIDTTK
jgi:hypothetical protein